MRKFEKLEKIKGVFADVWHLWYVKYLLVCIIGILIVGFFDENSVLSHFYNMQRKEELKAEIKVYEDLNQKNKEKIKQLQENPKAMEKIARERYFMKADDEDIFVLSDDNPQTSAIAPTNE